ncbi:MAG: DUF1499 domain-containing protein [Rhizobiaceae bacterium]|nr:DUF1499 domain-containing protein [Rhizobiaceae bacterium]
MAGIFVERYSRAAVWCQRLAVFLIPYFVTVILLFRLSKIETSQLFALIGVGFMLVLISLVFAFRSISELWNKGYRGGTMVVRGLLITLIMLVPFVYYSYLALQFPLANDVSTDPFNPPEYVTAQETRLGLLSEGVNPVGEYIRDHALKMIEAYPKLQPRRYPAGAERVLEAVRSIVEENEWPVTGSQGIPENRVEDTESELADNSGNSQNEDQSASLEETVEKPDDIYFEFIERTPVFGFENDVIIRIVSEDRNTLVDVRASSRLGRHDFGYNATLIERILTQLDGALLGIAGEG